MSYECLPIYKGFRLKPWKQTKQHTHLNLSAWPPFSATKAANRKARTPRLGRRFQTSSKGIDIINSHSSNDSTKTHTTQTKVVSQSGSSHLTTKTRTQWIGITSITDLNLVIQQLTNDNSFPSWNFTFDYIYKVLKILRSFNFIHNGNSKIFS